MSEQAVSCERIKNLAIVVAKCQIIRSLNKGAIMKFSPRLLSLCLPVLLSTYAHAHRPAFDGLFYGKVLNYRCENTRPFGEICVVAIENFDSEEGNGPKFIGVVLEVEDRDVTFGLDNYLFPDAPVMVDLGYTDKVDNPTRLKYLKNRYGKKFQYFLGFAYGLYDIIDLQRRE